MKYPLVLTLKSTKAINDQAQAIAEATGRNRSEYVRDVIQTLAKDQDLRQAVNKALEETHEG